MPGIIWTVEKHDIFKISLVVRREALSITLLVEDCTDLKDIVHFYRVRVTEFSTRGGQNSPNFVSGELTITRSIRSF